MAGENKQINELSTRTFDGNSLVPFDLPNTDPSTQAQKPYVTGKCNGHDVADFVANTEEYTTDLDTTAKTITGAINELHAINGYSYDAYDDTATYAVGDLCIHNNTLYKCTTAITTPEAWNASHWTATSIAEEINELYTPIPVTINNVETASMSIIDNTSYSIGKLVVVNIRINVTTSINGGRLIINGLPKSTSSLSSGSSFGALSSIRDNNAFSLGTYDNDTGIITMNVLTVQSYCISGCYIKA